VNFTAKTFSVTEKLDLGFIPKDKEEGEIPIPDSLIDRLRARRKKYPDSRLIFPGKGGKPNGHFLRTLKGLALRAGMNCGHCYNKKGKCCATNPVCKRFELHRFRKTFATMHHEARVSARTIQLWLRHSDLETTLKYLAASDHKSEKTREQVNNTFAFVKVAACSSCRDAEDKLIGEHIQGRHDRAGISLHEATRSSTKYNCQPAQAAELRPR
jgi:integrase/recombinase XerD